MIASVMRQGLPTGTVTFLFTDVEGSTNLLHELGAAIYAEALAEHRRVIREACTAQDGVEVDTQGDAFFFAFPTAPGALAAAGDFTERLAVDGPIRVRVGLHTGTPFLGGEGYVGDDVHVAARVAASAHGGQVVLSRATAELLELPLTNLGEHKLKDIEEAVAIFQLGGASFPPLKTISNTNLPRPASSFLGRERELSEVLAKIEEGARLVTLTGPGGTGKTRLALEAASSLVPEYKAGVFWIGLASLRDPDLVTETIAQTLGAKDSVAVHIGEREMLLLLDNLEQVIEAAPELPELLRGCPNLTLLVTSRELLRVQGEVEYPVPPLAESEALSLFCERSQLEPSDEIAELCARLDSLPLAVELAAARTKALSPAQILGRLSGRLDLLKGGRDADPRQHTLRATIEWSYDLLSFAEQRLFARLSVFAGGCTLEAAEEVVDADLDTLQSLVEKSLLRYSGERYWMLETIREYAGERLAEGGEAEELAQQHVQHFLALAETAETELWAQQTDVWLPRLDPEEANFRAALAWAIGGEETEVAVRLAGSLYPFWEIRARHGEARAWLSRALALGGAVPPSCRAKALVAAGRATSWQFDWPAAITLLEEGAELCRKLEDPEGVGRCLGFIAHARLFTGDSAGAAAALNEGVELARSTGDRRSLARALYNAAFAPIEERNFDRAREMFEEAAGIARAEGMKLSLALSLIHLGYTAVLAGDFERAAKHLNEGVDLFDELGETTWTPVAHLYLGLLALLGGKIEEAESILRTSLMEGREQAPQQQLPDWIEALAAVATAKSEALRAATLWGATDALFEKRGLAILEVNRQVRERFRDEAEGSLQSDSRAEAWAQGHAMTLEQAVAYALSESGPRAPRPWGRQETRTALGT
jgi:predicted ATPase/class 3 adenylate cyclase